MVELALDGRGCAIGEPPGLAILDQFLQPGCGSVVHRDQFLRVFITQFIQRKIALPGNP